MLNFNIMKNILFHIFHEHNNSKLDLFALFQKNQILGCYDSTPLKMNLVLEIRKTSTRRQGYSVFGFFFTSSCSSIVLIRIPLYFAYLLTLLRVTCSTNSKILTGTLKNSQLSPITSPPFLFSPYLLDLFLHMFTFQRSLLTFLVRKRIYHQSSKH